MAATDSLSAHEHERREQILTQSEPSKLPGSHAGAVLKREELFLLTDDGGDVPWKLPHAFGLYHRDTRFLNGLTLELQGQPLVALANAHLSGYDAAVELANAAFTDDHGIDVPQHKVCIRRERRLHGGVVHERICVNNYHSRDVTLRLEIRFRCDFEDIFVVKRFLAGPCGQTAEPTLRGPGHIVLDYRGIDGRRRETHLVFEPVPAQLDQTLAVYRLHVGASQSASIALAVTPVVGVDSRSAGRPRAPEGLAPRITRADKLWVESSTIVRSSSDLFDRIFAQALRDLRLLRSRMGRHRYFAAGIPWFVTLFGRDAATAAIQTLPYGRTIAHDTLELLAKYQARWFDAYRDAEPGKILHELRRGELAGAGEIPQSPAYYGSVDATPLFLILFTEYVLWSGDLALVHRHRQEIDAALSWVEARIDADPDGYLTYDGRYATGLINQGWKDSGNAIVGSNGQLLEPPIAVAEAQGYLFRALRETALIRRALGRERDAAALDERSEKLRERFGRDFWSDAIGCHVLARQRDGYPADVVASNTGQVLWSAIAGEVHARQVASRLLQDDMFTGWGIRTLSTRELAYNPVSYHLGSVWPHDNALILAGFRRYGLDAEALRVFNGLLDAAIDFRGRLPELFCGFPRRLNESPVPYPASSSPQAWAAGALPHALWNLLGLRPNALEHRLRVVRPVLPERLDWLTLSGLCIGEAVVDLRFERSNGRVATSADVRHGSVDIQLIDDMPPDSWD